MNGSSHGGKKGGDPAAKRARPVITVLEARPMSEVGFRADSPASPVDAGAAPPVVSSPTANNGCASPRSKKKSAAPPPPGRPKAPPSRPATRPKSEAPAAQPRAMTEEYHGGPLRPERKPRPAPRPSSMHGRLPPEQPTTLQKTAWSSMEEVGGGGSSFSRSPGLHRKKAAPPVPASPPARPHSIAVAASSGGASAEAVEPTSSQPTQTPQGAQPSGAVEESAPMSPLTSPAADGAVGPKPSTEPSQQDEVDTGHDGAVTITVGQKKRPTIIRPGRANASVDKPDDSAASVMASEPIRGDTPKDDCSEKEESQTSAAEAPRKRPTIIRTKPPAASPQIEVSVTAEKPDNIETDPPEGDYDSVVSEITTHKSLKPAMVPPIKTSFEYPAKRPVTPEPRSSPVAKSPPGDAYPGKRPVTPEPRSSPVAKSPPGDAYPGKRPVTPEPKSSPVTKSPPGHVTLAAEVNDMTDKDVSVTVNSESIKIQPTQMSSEKPVKQIIESENVKMDTWDNQEESKCEVDLSVVPVKDPSPRVEKGTPGTDVKADLTSDIDKILQLEAMTSRSKSPTDPDEPDQLAEDIAKILQKSPAEPEPIPVEVLLRNNNAPAKEEAADSTLLSVVRVAKTETEVTAAPPPQADRAEPQGEVLLIEKPEVKPPLLPRDKPSVKAKPPLPTKPKPAVASKPLLRREHSKEGKEQRPSSMHEMRSMEKKKRPRSLADSKSSFVMSAALKSSLGSEALGNSSSAPTSPGFARKSWSPPKDNSKADAQSPPQVADKPSGIFRKSWLSKDTMSSSHDNIPAAASRAVPAEPKKPSSVPNSPGLLRKSWDPQPNEDKPNHPMKTSPKALNINTDSSPTKSKPPPISPKPPPVSPKPQIPIKPDSSKPPVSPKPTSNPESPRPLLSPKPWGAPSTLRSVAAPKSSPPKPSVTGPDVHTPSPPRSPVVITPPRIEANKVHSTVTSPGESPVYVNVAYGSADSSSNPKSVTSPISPVKESPGYVNIKYGSIDTSSNPKSVTSPTSPVKESPGYVNIKYGSVDTSSKPKPVASPTSPILSPSSPKHLETGASPVRSASPGLYSVIRKKVSGEIDDDPITVAPVVQAPPGPVLSPIKKEDQFSNKVPESKPTEQYPGYERRDSFDVLCVTTVDKSQPERVSFEEKSRPAPLGIPMDIIEDMAEVSIKSPTKKPPPTPTRVSSLPEEQRPESPIVPGETLDKGEVRTPDTRGTDVPEAGEVESVQAAVTESSQQLNMSITESADHVSTPAPGPVLESPHPADSPPPELPQRSPTSPVARPPPPKPELLLESSPASVDTDPIPRPNRAAPPKPSRQIKPEDATGQADIPVPARAAPPKPSRPTRKSDDAPPRPAPPSLTESEEGEEPVFDEVAATLAVPPSRPAPPKGLAKTRAVARSAASSQAKQQPAKPPPPKPPVRTSSLDGKPARPGPPKPVKSPLAKTAGSPPPRLPQRPGPGHPLFHYVVQGPHAIAMYDYNSAVPDELKFRAGDVILLEKYISNDWLLGRTTGENAMFPVNFVDVIEPPPKPTTPVSPTGFSKEMQTPVAKDTGSGPRCVARFDFESDGAGDLNFREGELIRLTGRVGADWLQGQIGERVGMFPITFVEILEDLPASAPDVSPADSTGPPPHMEKPYCIAKFDFAGETPEDLPFHVGDHIELTGQAGGDWLHGSLAGRQGIFPSAFVEIVRGLPGQASGPPAMASPPVQSAVVSSPPSSPSPVRSPSSSKPTPMGRVIFDFPGQTPDDLVVKTGDEIELIAWVGSDWLRAKLGSNQGILPANFVDIVHPLP